MMFLSRHKKQIEESKRAFSQTVKTVSHLLDTVFEGSDLDIQKAEILNFSIDLIGRELAYSTASRLLRFGTTPENMRFTIPVPMAAYVDRQNLSLSGFNVVSDTYDCQKLVSAIRHIKSTGFRQISNYTGIYYQEINLAVVENGRHHLSVAMLYDGGSAKLQICSLKKAFGYLTTDGAFWYGADGNPIYQVPDYRLAVLFELARIREKFMLPADTKELKDRIFNIPEYVDPRTAYRESLFRIEWLELELGIKNLQLQKISEHKGHDEIEQELSRLEENTKSLAHELNAWAKHTGKSVPGTYLYWDKLKKN